MTRIEAVRKAIEDMFGEDFFHLENYSDNRVVDLVANRLSPLQRQTILKEVKRYTE